MTIAITLSIKYYRRHAPPIPQLLVGWTLRHLLDTALIVEKLAHLSSICRTKTVSVLLTLDKLPLLYSIATFRTKYHVGVGCCRTSLWIIELAASRTSESRYRKAQSNLPLVHTDNVC